MSNPYLSTDGLSQLESLTDTNKLLITIPGSGSGYVTLGDFRDQYLMPPVKAQIASLQSAPSNGGFSNPITLSFTGAVTGSVSFDGTANVSADMAIPDGSIPISAVTDLASVINAIENELGMVPFLRSSYFSNVAGGSQNTMLGYWNTHTVGLSGQDPAGVIFEVSSDGSNTPSSTNYVSQLLMGSAGTLTWRHNTENSGWSQVQLWHTGNLTPSNYVAQHGVAMLSSMAVVSLGGDAGVYVASNNSPAYQTVLYNSETTGMSGIAITDNAGNPNGSVLSWDRITGALAVHGDLTFSGGDGLRWSGGASFKTSTSGQTAVIHGGGGSGNILELSTVSGNKVTYWDYAGNLTVNAGIISSGLLKGATGVVTGALAVGSTNNPLAVLDVVTKAGHLLVEETHGALTLASTNVNNTAYAALNFVSTSFVFSGGAVTVDDNLTVMGSFSNPSDSRLKTNIQRYRVVPYHREAPFFTYDRTDIGTSGQGPMAQAIQAVSDAYVHPYSHLNRNTQRRVKRLAIDKVGIALEQAYWASYEVDALRGLVTELTARLDALEAKQKKR